MINATSSQVQRDFASYRDLATGAHGVAGPVTVLDEGHASVVIVSAAEFARLKRRDKRAMATEDLPEWLIEQIAASEMDARFAHLDRGE